MSDERSEAAPSGFFELRTEDGEGGRDFVAYVPKGAAGAGALPTILFLHGRGECGDDGLKPLSVGLGAAVLADRVRWPFLCVFPQKSLVDGPWYDERAYLDAVLARVERTFRVDPERRYLTGISQGGNGVFRLSAVLRWRFAAVAPVCGWCDSEDALAALRDTPLWAFHGALDRVVPYEASTSAVETLRAAGADARLTTYADLAHNSWDRAYRESDLPAWLLAHSLASARR